MLSVKLSVMFYHVLFFDCDWRPSILTVQFYCNVPSGKRLHSYWKWPIYTRRETVHGSSQLHNWNPIRGKGLIYLNWRGMFFQTVPSLCFFHTSCQIKWFCEEKQIFDLCEFTQHSLDCCGAMSLSRTPSWEPQWGRRIGNHLDLVWVEFLVSPKWTWSWTG